MSSLTVKSPISTTSSNDKSRIVSPSPPPPSPISEHVHSMVDAKNIPPQKKYYLPKSCFIDPSLLSWMK
jgi:hypothetical protein